MKLDEIVSTMEREKNNLVALEKDLIACKVRLNIFKTTIDGVSNGGSSTRKIAEKIEHEKNNQVEIEKEITESKAKISAYEDLVKILPKQENTKLREGTEISNIEKFIRSKGKEVLLDDIVNHFIKPDEDALKKKKSLRGTLRSYIRGGKVFAEGNELDSYTLIEFKRLDGNNESNNNEKSN